MIPELELGLEVFLGGLASYETLRAILAPKAPKLYSVLPVRGSLKVAALI